MSGLENQLRTNYLELAKQYKEQISNLSSGYKRDMKRLEVQNEQLQHQVNELSAQVTNLNEQVRTLNEQINSLTNAYDKFTSTLREAGEL